MRPFHVFSSLARREGCPRPLVAALALFLGGCSGLPPRTLQLAIFAQPGKVDVHAKAEGKEVGDTRNAPPSVAACVERRTHELERLGFALYVAAFRERPVLLAAFPRLSGCAFDGFDDSQHDRFLLPFALHEGTHLLGSMLDGVCPSGRPRCDARKRRYAVFTGEPDALRVSIPYVPGLPAVGTLADELGADTILDSLRTYLGLPSRDGTDASVDAVTEALGRGDFYLLWDEWNAYLTSLEIYTAQAAEADCWVYMTFDTYEVALSWPDLLERYLAHLARRKPASYRALVADGRFGRALDRQLDRSERAIERAAKYDCVRRGRREVTEAEARYTTAYGALRRRARRP